MHCFFFRKVIMITFRRYLEDSATLAADGRTAWIGSNRPTDDEVVGFSRCSMF
jgi:hypothetical protein